MKKTLVALAVLAAAGTSFAQVTITGKLGFGAQKTPANTDANANTGQGLLMTDGDVLFTATEDLGSGMKAIVASEIRLRGRDDQVSARNATISLQTGFGLISMGSIEAVSPLLTVGAAGAPIELSTNMDGNASGRTNTPIAPRTNIDAVSLTLPIGPVTTTILYSEVGGAAGAAPLYGAAVGLPGNDNSGNLTGGNRTGLTAWTLIGRYNAGPIGLYADYTLFDSKLTNTIITAAQTAAPGLVPAGSSAAVITAAGNTLANNIVGFYKDWGRTRLAATYDFGVAKLGVGYLNAGHDYPDQYSAGLTVPMGAVTFGLTYASTDKAKSTYALAPNRIERTFTGAGVQYDFSKMTNINLSYGTFTGAGGRTDGTGTSNPLNDYTDEYRIRLLKKF